MHQDLKEACRAFEQYRLEQLYKTDEIVNCFKEYETKMREEISLIISNLVTEDILNQVLDKSFDIVANHSFKINNMVYCSGYFDAIEIGKEIEIKSKRG